MIDMAYELSLPLCDQKTTLDQTVQRGNMDALLLLSVGALAAELTISGNTLMWLGIPYIAEGGNWIEKIHPGTYLSALALAVRLSQLYKARCLGAYILKFSDPAIFLMSIILCMAYAALETGSGGLITLIDSFLPAGMLALALADAAPSVRSHLRKLMLVLFMVNAVVALGETVAGQHLIPIAGNVPELANEFRPTGFYDHPLTAAASTMMGLFLYLGRRGPKRRLPLYECILLIALAAYGGRAVILLTAVGLGFVYARPLWHAALRRGLGRIHALSGCAALVALVVAGTAIAQAGVSERLLAHLYWDPSAQSRIYQFNILRYMDGVQFLFGVRRSELLALIEPLRIQYGIDVIENFWLLMFCTLGLICFPVFAAGLLFLVRFLRRSSNAHIQMMVVLVVLAASCSNSLGRKSTLLVTLVGCVAASDPIGRSARAKPRPLFELVILNHAL